MVTALIPKRCGSCGTPLSKEEINWCGLCEFSWVRHSGHAHCRFGERLDWRLQWSWLRLATPLERQLVHSLKYDGDASLGHALGARMAREFTMGQAPQDFKSWSIVPVPLHRRRLRQRGYNQSMQLARGWSAVTGMQITPLLMRKNAGQSFTRFNRSQRIALHSVQFDWPETPSTMPENIPGCIIIDDVITTGSTLESMHHSLRRRWHGPLAFITLADATS